MTKLYTKLARVYHEMYQSIFNYKKEFNFYNKLLIKYKCRKILEIGCGTGNLAKYFLKSGYDYTGLDFSKGMLKIAKGVEPKARFIYGDMRNLRLRGKFDAILITGRSFTYMATNDDVISSLTSINNHLKRKGVLIFDNFNAEAIFDNFEKKIITHARYNNKKYKRIIKKSINLNNGWTWDLDETYYVTEKGKTNIFRNKETLRAFTIDEINLFLRLGRFRILNNIKQNFSFTTVARKI